MTAQPMLFAPDETAKEKSKRLKRIDALREEIQSVSASHEATQGLIGSVFQFLAISEKGEMNANVWDGWYRIAPWDEELIEDDEWEAVHANPDAWVPVPEYWLGGSGFVRKSFVPSEVAHIESAVAELNTDADNYLCYLQSLQAELAKLEAA